MARAYRLVVGPKEATLRLDRYLVRHLPQTLSRAVVQRAIQEGLVTVNGRVAKAHRQLKAGETIVARCEPRLQPSHHAVVMPEPIPLDIVYEDDALLVVNKPPNLVTHPAPGHPSGTLVNAVMWHLRHGPQPRTPNPERFLPRAGLVHRLDKDTSGLLVVAKTEAALRALANQLKARTMSRRYLALVKGHVGMEEGTVSVGVGRHLTHRKEMAVRYLGGRQAVTHYRVLGRFRVEGCGLGPEPRTPNPERLLYTWLEVRLETGRTHQIRVHLAHLGHPVLGDPVYGRRSASDWSALGIRRQLLHACAIRFIHPTTNRPIELKAPIPADMQRWLD